MRKNAKTKSDLMIAAKWMQKRKPCIHGKGQICFWVESSKECQECIAEYRKEENAKSK